jgi:hypothetical protein
LIRVGDGNNRCRTVILTVRPLRRHARGVALTKRLDPLGWAPTGSLAAPIEVLAAAIVSRGLVAAALGFQLQEADYFYPSVNLCHCPLLAHASALGCFADRRGDAEAAVL